VLQAGETADVVEVVVCQEDSFDIRERCACPLDAYLNSVCVPRRACVDKRRSSVVGLDKIGVHAVATEASNAVLERCHVGGDDGPE
jgi:hypothetical protein